MKQNYFIGKTITGIKIARDKKALLFITRENGRGIVRTDGDCCSSSWVESVSLPALGFPAVVTAVDDLELPGTVENEKGLMRVYGVKMTTDRGEIIIDFRNSSNGYYGGNLSWPDDKYFCGGVCGQNVSNEEWHELADA